MKYWLRLFFIIFIIGGCLNSEVKDKSIEVSINKQKKINPYSNTAIAKPDNVEVGLAFSREEMEIGNVTISNDKTGNDNLLSGYLIFKTDFSGELIASAYNKQNNEFAKAFVKIEGKKNEIKNIQFHFLNYVHLDSNCKIGIGEVIVD